MLMMPLFLLLRVAYEVVEPLVIVPNSMLPPSLLMVPWELVIMPVGVTNMWPLLVMMPSLLLVSLLLFITKVCDAEIVKI